MRVEELKVVQRMTDVIAIIVGKDVCNILSTAQLRCKEYKSSS